MTNKEKFITMLKDEDDYAIGLLECPPTCDDGCPSGADGELISCDTCKKMWLEAEVE